MNLKTVDERIHKLIASYKLLAPGDRVVVGVSGGPDSLLLLHWLKRYRPKYKLFLVAAHLNHQLRKEADQEEEFVRDQCARWEIPCITQKVDVARHARHNGLSIQVAARQCRYAFFQEVATSQGCGKVALAHHADDQVETVLMRLIRGAGLDGLAGIPVKRSLTSTLEVIRPLLALTKDQIEAYCQHYQLNPRLDQSNLKDDYTRNWVRHHLIPKMKALNPNLAVGVQEMTRLMAEDSQFLTELAKERLEQLKPIYKEGEVRLQVAKLASQPLALQRRMILLLLSYLLDIQRLSKVHIDAVLHIIQSEEGTQVLHLPDRVQIERQYGMLIMKRKDEGGGRPLEGWEAYCYEIKEPGVYRWPGLPFEVIVEHQSLGSPGEARCKSDTGKEDPFTTSLSLDVQSLHLPLMVRNRRPGDKIKLAGLSGHSKVKDLFINHKLPRPARAWWPLVADQKGLLWIPGLAKADRTRLTSRTKEIYTVTFQFREGL